MQQMLFDDLVHIFLIDIGIPDPFGINDHYRPFFASVKAPGGIDANPTWTGYTQILAAQFGVIAQGTRIEALTAGAAVFTKIGAEKDVIAVVGHAVTIPENTGRVKNPLTGKYPPDHVIFISMTERNLTFFDRCIEQFDQAVRTVFGQPSGSGRVNPGQSATGAELTATEKAESICLMRVNHAGEVCAQALYQGQAMTARHNEVREQMQQAATEENDHLLWCRQRLDELDGHTSLLNPLWYTGSFMIGAATGLLGDKWSLGFLAETEHQVVNHLQSHLERLPGTDSKSSAILVQMKEDEARHKASALHSGGSALPGSAKKIMTLMSRVMTLAAYRI
jgi:ubiquinone biosynthesis monooxygenase Coq7